MFILIHRNNINEAMDIAFWNKDILEKFWNKCNFYRKSSTDSKGHKKTTTVKGGCFFYGSGCLMGYSRKRVLLAP